MAGNEQFCSAQPCQRKAEGNLEIVRPGGAVELWPLCARHAEFIEDEHRHTGIDPVTLLEREVVFVDDIAEEHRFVVDLVAKDQNYYRIIGE